MPTRNLYFSDPVYKEVSQLAEDLNLPVNDTFRELINKGLAFYKRHFKEILEDEAKTLTEEKEKE